MCFSHYVVPLPPQVLNENELASFFLFLCHSLGQLSRKTSDEERVNIAAS